MRKFYEDFSDASRVDSGRTIDAVSDPKVFRIKTGDWRAAVRYIPEDGVVWMCRVVRLSKFRREQDAYAQLGAFCDSDVLLPADQERRQARGDQFLTSAVAALQQARVNADNEPFQWWTADAQRPDSTVFRVGRIYAEREVVDSEGEFITRFLLLMTEPPEDVQLRPGWQTLITAHVFPAGEPVDPTWELPPGTNWQRGTEQPFTQQTVEFLDEEEFDLGA